MAIQKPIKAMNGCNVLVLVLMLVLVAVFSTLN
jgi:hypothetical protein